MTTPRQFGLIGLVACLTSLAFLLGFDHPVVSDAVSYDTMGWNLAQGRGLSLSTEPPYAPTMFREPLYPAFLSVIYRAAGHRPEVVPYWQIPLFIVICWLAYALGAQWGGRRVGWWSGMLTAVFPVLANYPSYVLTETLFTLLVVASVGACCRAWATRRAGWWAAAGLLQGLAALCRAVMAPAAVLVALAALVIRDEAYPRRRRLPHLAVSLLACGLVVAPWILRNQRLFGVPGITLRGEMVLWIRTNKLDDSPTQILSTALYNVSEFIGHLGFPQAAENPRNVILGDSHAVYEREQELMGQGLSQVEANERLGVEAWARIRQHPLKYVLYTPVEMLKLTAFSYVPSLNEAGTIQSFERLPGGRLLLALVRGSARVLAYPVLFLMIYGLWAARAQWRQWWPIGLIVAYVNGLHGLLFSIGRYVVPLVPFYVICAVVGFQAWRRGRKLA
jgi:4-amino-4-deoxy-L-arabinose transferase-like glycosyltransferase